MSQRKMPAAVKSATELGPIVIFFAVYSLYDRVMGVEAPADGAAEAAIGVSNSLFAATGAIMITTLIALVISYYYERKIPAMPLITAIVITVFGGLTLYLQDDTFIKMKPTIIYILFSGALGAGMLFGKSFIKVLFGNFWNLDDHGWRKLTFRLIAFFLTLAIANEVVWRNFSTDLWVSIKVFGFTGVTFVFFLAQVPLLTKHTLNSEAKN
ncbi:hypothetical protein A9Q83_13155 [Alphaproteobacteria bacterium 46_93_T64]|nr:hypothetical protein A9Q83_13155 [Alphaproteobacteria bacterium 46_93_T64]